MIAYCGSPPPWHFDFRAFWYTLSSILYQMVITTILIRIITNTIILTIMITMMMMMMNFMITWVQGELPSGARWGRSTYQLATARFQPVIDHHDHDQVHHDDDDHDDQAKMMVMIMIMMILMKMMIMMILMKMMRMMTITVISKTSRVKFRLLPFSSKEIRPVNPSKLISLISCLSRSGW